MKNYMNRWVLLALKAIVILVWLACLWGQLFAVPGLSGALAGLYPSQTSMRWPYLIMGVLFLFCIEAAFVVAVILNTVLPSEEHFLSAPKEAPAADAE